MKLTHLVLTATLVLLAATSMAQESSNTGNSHRYVYFNLGMGIAEGGDDIMKLKYSDGQSDTIKSGSGIIWNAGILITPQNNAQILLTYGLHTDEDDADNGDISFKRNTTDLVALYKVKHNHRIGFGVTQHQSTKFDVDFAGADYTLKYKNATGFILQWDWISTNFKGQVGNIGLRYVDIEYEPEYSFIFDGYDIYEMKTLDGSHFALNLGYAF